MSVRFAYPAFVLLAGRRTGTISVSLVPTHHGNLAKMRHAHSFRSERLYQVRMQAVGSSGRTVSRYYSQEDAIHHGDVSPEIAQGLLALKKRIAAAKIPPSKLDETINVAIWNIREFGKVRRTDAAIHLIAEILGQFDLVALVELRNDLTDIGRTLPILGPSWDIVYSDWIDDAGGNKERAAFLYDRRAVTFNGLAAEVDPPRGKKGTEYLAKQSFWRAPYMCSFRAGNFDFIAIAAHARWGDSIMGRQAELQVLADWIDTRFKDKYVEDHDLIVIPGGPESSIRARRTSPPNPHAPREHCTRGDRLCVGSGHIGPSPRGH